MIKYGFSENKDYWTILIRSAKDRLATNHMLTTQMAKELCMIQRTDIGRKIRKYFLDKENAWDSPEIVMKRAMEIANERVKALQIQTF